jgi:hypothetical protein
MSSFLRGIGNFYDNIISAGTTLIVRLVTGIGNAAGRVVTAAANAASKFVLTFSKGAAKVANAAGQALLNFLHALDAAVNKYSPQITQAALQIGADLVSGITKGILNNFGKPLDAIKHLGGSIVGAAKHILKVFSPSQVFMEIGAYLVEGLAIGLSDHGSATDAAASMSNNVIDTFKGIFEITSPSKVMIKIGQDVNRGFVQGLQGDADHIKGAFNNLNDQIKQALDQEHALIKSNQDKIDAEQKKKKPDTKAIHEWRTEISHAKDDINNLNGAHKELSKGLDKEKNTLVDLQNQYAKMKQRVDDATQSLINAKQARDDFVANTTNTLSATPDFVTTDADGNPIDPATQVQNYTDSLNSSGDAVAQFGNDLATLKGMGLDDTTYKKLLDIGPAADQFAKALINMGPGAVSAINAADVKLQSAAGTLGYNAGQVLYQAGVDAAQKTVDGLTDGINGKTPDGKTALNALKKSIDELVKTIVHQVKKQLGIKSPSSVFAEIGAWSNAGLAKGIADSTGVVTDAVSGVTDATVAAMKNGMAGVSEAMTMSIDSNPTITPILDLSQVQDTAKQLPGLLNPSGINAANAISLDTQGQTGAAGQAQAPIQFVQNNQSPASLSEIEIYRQTKNLLSQARPVLAT